MKDAIDSRTKAWKLHSLQNIGIVVPYLCMACAKSSTAFALLHLEICMNVWNPSSTTTKTPIRSGRERERTKYIYPKRWKTRARWNCCKNFTMHWGGVQFVWAEQPTLAKRGVHAPTAAMAVVLSRLFRYYIPLVSDGYIRKWTRDGDSETFAPRRIFISMLQCKSRTSSPGASLSLLTKIVPHSLTCPSKSL